MKINRMVMPLMLRVIRFNILKELATENTDDISVLYQIMFDPRKYNSKHMISIYGIFSCAFDFHL